MRSGEQEIARLFLRNGYIRKANPERLAGDGPAYKKGHELRFILDAGEDPQAVKRNLEAAGIKAAEYARGRRIRARARSSSRISCV